MAATIRLQVDPIAAELAAEQLRQEGIPVQVVSDSDLLAVTGVPLGFSLLVPEDREMRARQVLAEVERSHRD